MTPIDLLSGKVLPTIPLGSTAGPAGIAISPDGATAYVTDAGAAGTLGNTITPIDLATDKTLPPVTVGPGPQGIAITPDGRRAYVTDAGAFVPGQIGSIASTVTPVDLATGTALPAIPVGNAPTAIAITPDGSTALVANTNSGSVSPIDLADDKAGSPIAVQGNPISVAISPAQPTTAYVADAISGPSTTGNVTLIDLTSDTAGAPIAVGKNPQAIAMSPDGTTAWVVCYGSRTLVPLSTRTHLPGAAIRLPGGPYAIAVTQRSSSSQTATTTTSAKSGSGAKKTKTKATGLAIGRPRALNRGSEPGNSGRLQAGCAVFRRQPADTAEAVADAADGVDEMRVLLAQLGPQTPHVDVDGPSSSEVLIAPDPGQQRLAAEHPARMGGEKPKELILHVSQVQGTALDRRLIGLQVQRQGPVDDQVRILAATGAPEQVRETRFDLLGGRVRKHEVVEQVLSKLEIGEARLRHDEEQRL